MKKAFHGIAITVAFALSLSGCSTIPTIPSADPHPHRVLCAVSLGERHFHAAMQYDADLGEVRIRFFDANEKPYRTFKADRAKAALIVEGGPERKFYFSNTRRGGIHTFPSGRFRYDNYTYTDHIDAQSEFFKNLSAFKVKTWLPVDGVVYEAIFMYPHEEHQS